MAPDRAHGDGSGETQGRDARDEGTMLSRSWAHPMQKKIGRMFRAMSAWVAGLVAAWLLALAPAAAQTPVALDAASAHVSLDTAAQFWTDTSNEATPDQLAWDPSIPWRATKAGTGTSCARGRRCGCGSGSPRTALGSGAGFWRSPTHRSTGSRCSRWTRGAAGLRKLPATRCRWPAGLCRTGIRCCRWRWWPTASPSNSCCGWKTRTTSARRWPSSAKRRYFPQSSAFH